MDGFIFYVFLLIRDNIKLYSLININLSDINLSKYYYIFVREIILLSSHIYSLLFATSLKFDYLSMDCLYLTESIKYCNNIKFNSKSFN